MGKRFLGYQICNYAGVNIQGDDGDPTGYASYEIMSPQTAEMEVSKLQPGDSILLMPIYEGEIEGAEVV